MKILAIESSCDDTSIALVEATKSGFIVLSEKTASQIDIHKKYGGVIPEIAGRKHAEKILPTIEEVLKNHNKPDVIAVTSGPGLMTGLLVGTEVAKTLSYIWNIPTISTNHIEGHIYSVLLQNDQETNIQFPALCLIVSGGHTELILMKDHGNYEKIGGTRDDAAGECFDKVAKLLNLDYPGGPKISKYAESGDPKSINFPRPMLHSDDLDMSFSGLKTATLYHLRDNPIPNHQSPTINNFCASFQQAIVDVLIHKTIKAAKQYRPNTIILAGGVSANKTLRKTLQNSIQQKFPASKTLYPEPKYSMDNAAMIAVAGYFHAIKKDFTPWQKLEANPQWKIYKQNKIVK